MYSIISPDPGTTTSQKFAALSATGKWDIVLSKTNCRKNGASVCAKATCVTSISECIRKFETNFKKEVETGVIPGVIVPRKDSENKHHSTSIGPLSHRSNVEFSKFAMFNFVMMEKSYLVSFVTQMQSNFNLEQLT